MINAQPATLARLFPDVTSGRLVRPRLPILRYPSLDSRGGAQSLAPELFRWQMRQLLTGGWRVIGLDGLLAGLSHGWPARSTVLTFDEAYRNVRDHAVPLLRGYAFGALLFVSPVEPRTPARQPRALALLDWAELRELAEQGMTPGLRLPAEIDLRALPLEAAEQALLDMQAHLQDRLGQPVSALCGPLHAWPSALRAAAARHFRAGFGMRLGFARTSGAPLALERIDVRVLRHRAMFRALESGWLPTYLNARQALRDLQRRA